jgi:hypothetical protein
MPYQPALVDLTKPNTDALKLRRHIEPALVSLLFSKAVALVSLAGVVLSFVLPADGLGVSMCWFAANLHLPCPGCGLTRSVISVAHLDFAGALVQNPFGVVGYALFAASIALGLSPRGWTAGVRAWLGAQPRLCSVALNGLAGGLIAYGLLRLTYYVVTGTPYGG